MHMLSKEAKDWWDNASQKMEAVGTKTTWVVFTTGFLEKYFIENLHSKKEIEFLELKQGSMLVAAYAVKFEELVKFCQNYNREDVEGSKCINFENGLHPEIKQGLRY